MIPILLIVIILLETGHFGVVRIWILLNHCFNSQASYETPVVVKEGILPQYCQVGIEIKILHSGSIDPAGVSLHVSTGRTWNFDSPLGLWKHCQSWERRNTSISTRSQRMPIYIDDINGQRGHTFWNIIALVYKSTQKLDSPHERWGERPRDSVVLKQSPLSILDSILKSRDMTLLTKAHTFKAMVFPVIMYGCDH